MWAEQHVLLTQWTNTTASFVAEYQNNKSQSEIIPHDFTNKKQANNSDFFF